ncbi:MAG: polysaccharide deacetylase family protein [Prevotellaceae bacterium]|nr:polysaccharide deacetylase family protein [Candidatus Colivivens equi]
MFCPKKFPYGVIIGLHRVCDLDDKRLLGNEGLKITPSTLEDFIISSKKMGYHFTSLDEFYKIHTQHIKAKKVLCMTLDDAYKDNLDVALPIFRKHNIPFCIFVAPGLIDDPEYCWWYRLEDIIQQNDVVQYDGKSYLCKSREEKENVFWTIRNQIAVLNMTDLRTELKDKIDLYSTRYSHCAKDIFMSWEQVKEISQDPLCTIGAHTYHHVAFAGCNNEELKNELAMCQSSLQEHLGQEAKYFAYPYGDKLCVKDEHREWMHHQGYKAVFLAEGGGIHCNTDMLQAPRFCIYNDNGAKNIMRSLNRTMLRPIK